MRTMEVKLEHTSAGHFKFWEAETKVSPTGGVALINFGRIGTVGQTIKYDYPSLGAADSYVNKKVQEKLAKGYVRVSGDASPTPAPSQPKPKNVTVNSDALLGLLN